MWNIRTDEESDNWIDDQYGPIAKVLDLKHARELVELANYGAEMKAKLSKAGSTKSEAKAAAARESGKKGGRPPKKKYQIDCDLSEVEYNTGSDNG